MQDQSAATLTKKCRRCNIIKDVMEYHASHTDRSGAQAYCKDCQATYQRLRKFGISAETFAEMVNSQKGVCASCGSLPTSRGLMIDHCHKTGIIRGLLCNGCNSALGHLEDDIDKIFQLCAYLLSSRDILGGG